jgi:hypothetical protein
MSEREMGQTGKAHTQVLEKPGVALPDIKETATPAAAGGAIPSNTGDAPGGSPVRPGNPWFVLAVWDRIRPLLLELTVHILVFGLLLTVLTLFHYFIWRSELPDGQKEILDKLHFYGYVFILGIFTLSFIFKTLILEFRGKDDG